MTSVSTIRTVDQDHSLSEPVIQLRDVTVEIPVILPKRSSKPVSTPNGLVGGLIRPTRSKSKKVIRALTSIDLTVPLGSRIGLIGHNGAGKTTLLKTIAGLYPCSSGSVSVAGDIRTFFNISAGMELALSGRDNIRNVALYYTLNQQLIDEITPEVIAFSELGEFIDMPVASYSAGMATRLLVSIALNFRGDVLLMDELLGAGDAQFTKKVAEKVENMMQEAQTLVFATHAVETMQKFCTTGVWLEKGEVRLVGPIQDVVEAFTASLET